MRRGPGCGAARELPIVPFESVPITAVLTCAVLPVSMFSVLLKSSVLTSVRICARIAPFRPQRPGSRV